MPRFAANLTTMFTELEPKDRFLAAYNAGFDAVEYLAPYGHDISELRSLLQDAQLSMILLNTGIGDGQKGERGLAALPGRESDFESLFEQALTYASALQVEMIHVMAGVVPENSNATICENTFIANLKKVAPIAAREKIKLLIEPLNTQDVPGYLHTNSGHAARIISAVNEPNVRMQFDFYHLQIMEGNLGKNLENHWDSIGHIQFSSVPGRHEPQHGEVNLPFLFAKLDDMGYTGWIGCEYGPKHGTQDGLGWAAAYGIKPRS